MNKLMPYIATGVLLSLALMLINAFVPVELYYNNTFNHFMSICYFLCIIIPCIIYYIKTPPGESTKP